MIILTGNNKLQVKLSGAVSANQLECFASYRDTTSNSITPGRSVTLTNNTTAVDLVSAPASSTQRIIDYLSIYNADIATVTVTVQLDVNGTSYILSNFTLYTGEKIEYQKGIGFKCLNIAGAVKEGIKMGYNNISPNWSSVTLASDVINNNAVANTIQDVTGLSFSVVNGNTYWFRFFIPFASAASGTGSRWSINGPAFTSLYYISYYTLSITAFTQNQGLNAYDTPAAANATSAVNLTNIAVVEGIITPSADGTLIARFASEVANSAITAKAGAVVFYKQLN
jgi:hypothetical protein